MAGQVGAPPRARTDASTLTADQRLMVVYGTWRSGPAPLQIDDFPNLHLLLPADGRLFSSLPGGRVVMDGGSGNFNAGGPEPPPHSRMIVLFTGPIANTVRLQKPASGSVLYLQEGDRFRSYPPDMPAGQGIVEFAPDPTQPSLHVWVDHPLGGRQGGSVVLRSKWW